MRPNDYVCLLLFAAVAAFVPGCAPITHRPLQPMPPQELLRNVYATPGATALKAHGRIRVTTADGGYNGSILLFFRSPDSARFVIQAGFGTTLAELALTGATGVAYLPHQKQAFELAPGSAILVGDATIYPSLITRLLSPIEPEQPGDSVSVSIAGGNYYVRGVSPTGLRTWKIDGRTGNLRAEDFLSAEHTVEWHREFETTQNIRVPRYLSVRLGKTTTVINLTRIDVAPQWKGNEFHIRVPPDVEITGLDFP